MKVGRTLSSSKETSVLFLSTLSVDEMTRSDESVCDGLSLGEKEGGEERGKVVVRLGFKKEKETEEEEIESSQGNQLLRERGLAF